MLAKSAHVEQIIGAAVQLVGEDGEKMKKTLEDLRAMREELGRPPGARGRDGRDGMTCSTFYYLPS